MWIEKTPSGKFKACERYTDPMTGKEKKVSVTLKKNTASSRKLAMQTLANKIAEKVAPAASHKDLTVSELISLYLDDQKKTTKDSTYRRSVFSCKNVKRFLGGDTLVEKLTSGYIRKSILSTGKKPNTMNEYLKRTKLVLRWGYKNDYVENISYLDKIERFKDSTAREKIRDKYLESNELKAVIDAMTLQKWKDMTLFLALTGMRIGEALALTTNDVDIVNREIHINKTYDTNNKVTTTPKTIDSFRDIYIQDELLPLVRRIRQSALAYRLANKSDLLFQDSNGRYDYNAFRKHFRVYTMKVLDRKCTPHILRHTHTSLMAEQGIPLDVISRRLGHSDSRITKEIYFHVTKNLKKKDDALFRSVSVF